MHNTSEYPQMVTALAKPGEAILKSLTPVKCDLYHMSDALVIEAAELADAVKRHVIYEKPLGSVLKEGQTILENIVEELGDMEFYMERIRQLIGITREEALQHNMEKLGKRYAEKKYSNEQANARADKVAEVELFGSTKLNFETVNTDLTHAQLVAIYQAYSTNPLLNIDSGIIHFLEQNGFNSEKVRTRKTVSELHLILEDKDGTCVHLWKDNNSHSTWVLA